MIWISRRDVELKFHVSIFTIWNIDTVLLAMQSCILSINLKSNASIHTAHDVCIIVRYVCTSIDKFKLLTPYTICRRVISKEIEINGCSCSTLYTEVGSTLCISMIATTALVKVIRYRHGMSTIRPESVLICIGLTNRIEVKNKSICNLTNISSELLYLYSNRLSSLKSFLNSSTTL